MLSMLYMLRCHAPWWRMPLSSTSVASTFVLPSFSQRSPAQSRCRTQQSEVEIHPSEAVSGLMSGRGGALGKSLVLRAELRREGCGSGPFGEAKEDRVRLSNVSGARGPC